MTVGGDPEGAEENEEPVSEERKIFKLFNHFVMFLANDI
jgi:hypothetical protein